MTTRWALADPMRLSASYDYSFVGVLDGWEAQGSEDLESRDLGLSTASGGHIGAIHLRSRTTRAVALPPRDAAARFLLVLAGELVVERDGDTATALIERGFVYHPPGTEDVLVLQPGSEVLEISALAEPVATATGTSGALAPDPIYDDDEQSDWVESGLRSFFRYRHLPAAGVTSGLIGLQLSEVVGPCPEGGTGFHHHSSSQIFYVLSGWVDLAMEAHGLVRVTAGDAVCIPAGGHARHNVTDFSPDYAIVEMFVPSEYETVGSTTAVELG